MSDVVVLVGSEKCKNPAATDTAITCDAPIKPGGINEKGNALVQVNEFCVNSEGVLTVLRNIISLSSCKRNIRLNIYQSRVKNLGAPINNVKPCTHFVEHVQ